MNTAKRFLTQLTAVTLAICVIFLSSCAPKKIDGEEYPGFVPIEETVTEKKVEEKEIPVEDIVEKGGMTDSEFEELIKIPDPFEETGKFQFCPGAIPENYARQYREKPEIVFVAKQMLTAVYNGASEFSIAPEYELSTDEAWLAEELAAKACPLADACSIGAHLEDPLTYSVIYMPKNDIVLDENGDIDDERSSFTDMDAVEAKKVIGDFTDFVKSLIDRNIKKEDSDMEKAEKIYEALVKEVAYREKRPYEDSMYIEFTEEGMEALRGETTLVEDIINDHATSKNRIPFLYQYILTQLNIECMTVTSSGAYVSQGYEKLDKEMGSDGRLVWNVIVIDGIPYNCDMAFDMIVYEAEKGANKDYEPVMKYFGMSDSTRAQSFVITSRDNLYLYDPNISYEWENPPRDMVPECPKDYQK